MIRIMPSQPSPEAREPRVGIVSEPPPENESSEAEQKRLLSELSLGTVIDAKYRIDQVLGRGAMGVVVSATHLRLNERVAVKFLHTRAQNGTSGPGKDDFQSRFAREARVSARLRNEHITRVVDAGLWRERVPYMVMEYLTGTDLREVMKKSGPLPIELALDYAVQVCEGIAEAHANGVVHRDLKPPNLFITKRADGSDLVKILDFGISKWTTRDAEITDLTETGVVLGSPKYMAPEQLFGAANVDSRADVWSIGAIVYEMLAGRAAFDFPTFSRICAELSTDRMPPSLTEGRPEIPKALDLAILRCFVRSPDARHQDVSELAGALLDAVEAPLAASTRHRIASTLGRRDAPDSHPVVSGHLSRSSLLSTGSGSSKRIAATARTGSGPLLSPAKRKGASPVVKVFAVASILAALGAGGWFVMRRYLGERPLTPPATAASVAAPVQQGAPPDATGTTTTPRDMPPGSAAPPESSAVRAPPSTNPVPEPAPVSEHQAAVGRTPRSHVARPVTPPPTPSPVATAATPVVPAAPPAPTPTVKADPLGDRQ
jgi:serine/threonine-protein kinase